jgi:hypothetical protein
VAEKTEAFYKLNELASANLVDILISTAMSSDAASLHASLSVRYGFPLILATGTSDAFSEKLDYPYFWRVTLSDSISTAPWLDMMLDFQWANFAILSEVGYADFTIMLDLARARNMSVNVFYVDPSRPETFDEALNGIKEAKNRIIFHIFGDVGAEIHERAVALNMLGPKSTRVWIVDNLRIDSDEMRRNLAGSIQLQFPLDQFLADYDIPEYQQYISIARTSVIHQMALAKQYRTVNHFPSKTQVQLSTNKEDMFTMAHRPSVPYHSGFLLAIKVYDQLYKEMDSWVPTTSVKPKPSLFNVSRALSQFSDIISGVGLQFDSNQDNVKTAPNYATISAVHDQLTVFATANKLEGYRRKLSYDKITWPDGSHRVPDDGISNELWIHYSSAGGVFSLLVFIILSILMTLSIVYILVVRKRSPVIKLATPWGLVIILVGMQMLLLSSQSWLGRPSPALCELRNWFFFGGSVMIFAALCAKSARITYIIYQADRLRSVSVRTWKVMVLTLILCIPIVILLGLNSGLSPSHDVRVLSTDHSRVDVICIHDYSTYIYLCFGYFGLLLLASLYFALKNRNVPTGFNETRHIFISEYVVAAVVIIGTVVSVTTKKSAPLVSILFSVIPMFFGVAILWIVLFGPKFYISYFRPDLNNKSLMKARVQSTEFASAVWTIEEED